VVPLTVPPLRERAEDIILLADNMLQIACRNYGIKVLGFSAVAREAMMQHDWPGNVRELQNTIERAVIMAEENGAIEPATLGLIHAEGEGMARAGGEYAGNGGWNGEHAAGFSPEGIKPLDLVEREHIMRALEETRGNRTQAAIMLGISIRTLRNKLNEYKMETVVG